MAIKFEHYNSNMTSIESKLKDISAALDKGSLPLGVFNDDMIFALEKKTIFSRSWNFLGHTSEIPMPGDYMQRYVVDDAFIVTRDENDDIHVLLNACRHRGRQVCRAEKGNTKSFTCPYHGWVYAINGNLMDVHCMEEIYAKEEFDKNKWGLVPAPRFAIWRDWIFANLDENAEDLEDYLGDAIWYLDFYTNKTPGGLEVHGVPQRWVVNADWKLAADNFVGDGYHTFITHASTIEAGSLPAQDGDFLKDGVQVVLENFGIGFARQDPMFNSLAYPPDMFESIKKRLNPEQRAVLDNNVSLPTHGNLFPNLSFLNAPGGFTRQAPPAPYMTFRVWRPLAAGRTEIWSWCLVEKDADEAFKQACYKAYVISFGASGTLEQDDAENWMTISKAAKGTMAGELMLNYAMGEKQLEPMSDWPGPGKAYPMDYTEFAQRAFWRKWLCMLEAKSS